MARIRVIPENLRSLSTMIAGKSAGLQSMDAQFQNILSSLDWEARQKVNIDEQVNNARRQAMNLSAQAEEFVRTLKTRAEAFEQADRQSAEQLGNLSKSIHQLVIGLSTGLNSLTDWLKKHWPFIPIAILPITVLPLLPDIPWPPKVKPMPIKPVTPLPVNPGFYKPKPPFDKIYIFPGGTYPKYGSNMGSWAGKKHDGVDIRPEPWDEKVSYPVSPIGPGKVVQVATQYMKDKNGQILLDENGNKKLDGYGNYVVIEHTLADGTKVYSRYAHLAELPKLAVGQEVGTNEANSNIGIMGSTGRSTAPHVHLEVWTTDSNNQKVLEDPLPVINGESNYQFIPPPAIKDN